MMNGCEYPRQVYPSILHSLRSLPGSDTALEPLPNFYSFSPHPVRESCIFRTIPPAQFYGTDPTTPMSKNTHIHQYAEVVGYTGDLKKENRAIRAVNTELTATLVRMQKKMNTPTGLPSRKRKLNTEVRMITGEEGFELSQKVDNAQKTKNAKTDVAAKKRRDETVMREHARTGQASNKSFRDFFNSKLKGDLQDILMFWKLPSMRSSPKTVC